MKLEGKGPFTKVNGQVTDAGLFDFVFNGDDDAFDEYVKLKRLQKIIRKEMQKRGMIEESLDAQLKKMALEF
jgi:hypothetical protein